MREIGLFWWGPGRSAHLLYDELRTKPSAWVHLAPQRGLLFRNFGDELSPAVVRAVTGRPVAWRPPERADLVAIGSVLELLLDVRGSAAVWGTGLRLPRGPRAPSRPQRVLAVRGALTRHALDLREDVPAGDPGLLAPRLAKRRPGRRSGMVFLPHYRTWSSRRGRADLGRARALGLRVVAPTLPVDDVLEAVAASEFVATSSLHGLVVAHALGTPAHLVAAGDTALAEPGFKFSDYASAMGGRAALGLEESAQWSEWQSARVLLDAVDRAADRAPGIRERAAERAEVLADALREGI